jgi:hypothetical protein
MKHDRDLMIPNIQDSIGEPALASIRSWAFAIPSEAK